MDASKLIDLFGHSVYSPEIDKAFEEFSAIVPDKSQLTRYDSVKTDYGITFTFWYKQFYETNIKPPQSTFKSKDEEEVVLFEMTFSDEKKVAYILPYQLSFGDSSEIVIDKLGQRPFSKSKNYDGQNTWIFYNYDFKIMPVFDNNLNLVWLRIWAINTSDKNKLNFKNELKKQNKNINQNDLEELKSLMTLKPTIAWYVRMSDGDRIFTSFKISASANILDNFIEDLIIATKSKKASAVYSNIKKVIKSFNKLNTTPNEFIDTMEREELIDFIEKAVKLTGFKITEGVDLTEDFREW